VVWFHAIGESRHELQNPTSAEKIRVVGAANPGHPQFDEIRDQYERAKRAHLAYRRDLLGWAMLVGWKPPQPATGSP